ncbi:hypothetical protein H4R35_003679 [Dimargaris xerosporica]|nr:hypothetical protein H4R35_003679 [Dimargaris xerosporica]
MASRYYEMKLYGGMMECEIPKDFENASTYRTIPDHQEVFVADTNDQSIIIEILEQADTEDDNCAKYHFDELAVDNEASSSEIITNDPIPDDNVPDLPSTAICHMVTGRQMVTKYKEKGPKAENYLLLYVAVARLKQFHVDIVISYNHPMYIAPGSSSSKTMTADPDAKASLAVFKHLLETLRITDYKLFGTPLW